MKIYFIEGKKVDLDSHEWIRIYYDGTWNSRGINLFWRKKDDVFILENWSNWQNERNSIQLFNRKEVIEYLYTQIGFSDSHPERVNDTFEIIGFNPKEF